MSLQNDMATLRIDSDRMTILENDPCCSSRRDPSCSSHNDTLFLKPGENFSLLDYIGDDNNVLLETTMEPSDFEYLKNSPPDLEPLKPLDDSSNLGPDSFLNDPSDFEQDPSNLEQDPSNLEPDSLNLEQDPSNLEQDPSNLEPDSSDQPLNDPSDFEPDPSDLEPSNLEPSNFEPDSSDLDTENAYEELKLALEFMFMLNKLFHLETGRWKRKHDAVCWDAAYTIRKLENRIKNLEHMFNVDLEKLKRLGAQLSSNGKRQLEQISNMMNEPTPKRIKKIKKCTLCG